MASSDPKVTVPEATPPLQALQAFGADSSAGKAIEVVVVLPGQRMDKSFLKP